MPVAQARAASFLNGDEAIYWLEDAGREYGNLTTAGSGSRSTFSFSASALRFGHSSKS
ncbi:MULTISPECIES: hypothetical protein [unclassified Mesorhizobium]|uniref:hypothetical protein n=1 Tax=unclassified Mesorhizobium TaxID=325217 RepID=UPI001CD01803|nr:MULTISPECIES: hypothetical protein [unclassified Mesorhizobium]MBZ9819127.1 hypothetical protein [Mesorhizobium sp. CA4]